MSKELAGKVALITGASRGIGKAIAITLAELGANIVVNYASNEDAANKTVEAITKTGSKAIAVKADIAKLADIKHLFEETVKFGGLDIFINNAAIAQMQPFAAVTEEDFDRMFNINAKATFFCLQEAAKIIRENGRIMTISTGLTCASGEPYLAHYAGSKAAVEQFTKAVAVELGPKKVTANTISPGFTDTDMLVPTFHKTGIESSVFKRLGVPQDIANVIGFLASPKAGWITGQNIRVNGGVQMPS